MVDFLSMEKLLRGLYYKLDSAGSFTGINALYQTAKRVDPRIRKIDVQTFLNKQHVYLRHRRIRKPRGRSQLHPRFVSTAPNINWSCDTALFPHSHNAHLLVCKDNFSGQTYARVQRNLKAATTLKNFNKMVEEQANSTIPHTTYTDRGASLFECVINKI